MRARANANRQAEAALSSAATPTHSAKDDAVSVESARAMLAAALMSLQRALDGRGAAAAVDRCFIADAEVVRYGWGDERDQRVETFAGVAAIRQWLERAPAACHFETGAIDTIDADGLGGSVRYRLEVAGFRGGGRWTLRLSADGRIARMGHHPDSLDPDIQDAVWRPLVEASLQPMVELADQVHGPHCRHPLSAVEGQRED